MDDVVDDASEVEDVKDVEAEGALPISDGTVWESSVAKPIIPITMTMTMTATIVVPIAAL